MVSDSGRRAKEVELKTWLFTQLVGVEDEQKRRDFAELIAPFFCETPEDIVQGSVASTIIPPSMPPNVIDETKRHPKTGSAPPKVAYTTRGSRTDAMLAAIGASPTDDVGTLASKVYGEDTAVTRNRARSLLHSLMQRGRVKHDKSGYHLLKP